MPDPLVPRSRPIKVKFEYLVLDPNNPRFTTSNVDRIEEENILEQDLTGRTYSRLFGNSDIYRISELVRSIRQNKWDPIDSMYVRKIKGDRRHFVVLEGNRRLAAIREIMKESSDEYALLRASLQTLEVMEVLGEGTDEQRERRISLLLGLRHGALRKWTPFAQAYDILKVYLEVSKQTVDSFKWDSGAGQTVADRLSVSVKDVQNRLKVYRVMFQVGNLPEVRDSKGGMVDKYYSVCATPLLSPRKKLGDYIKQDQSTFLLSGEGAARMSNLCNFSEPNRGGRDGAAIHNPQEWGALDKILGDLDTSKRDANLKKVEQDRMHPSDVWAERAMELSRLTWEKWLFKVNSILKTVTMADDFSSDEAKSTAKRLVELVAQLTERDIHKVGTDNA